MSIQVSTEESKVNAASSSLSSSATRDIYLLKLLDRVSKSHAGDSHADSYLKSLHDRAEAQVREQTFPSNRDEEWRFTNLAPMLQVEFAAASGQPSELSVDELETITLPESINSRLVFVDGIYSADLSSITSLPSGIIVQNLHKALTTDLKDRIEPRLAQQQGSNEVFTALNTTGFQDAAVVWIPKNQVVEQPIQLIFVSAAASIISQPRCLVVAEANSSVTLIEDYVGQDDINHFTNAVTEVWLGENAQVKHCRIQRDGDTTFHIGKTVVSQARDSRYTCNTVTLGAKLSRHNLETTQTGEQTHTELKGLAVIADRQVADTHSAIAFAKPHGTANQLHKCIVDDKAHSIFNGKVFVPHDAQLTNASQLNRNLLLSTKARVDTKPELEIVADNVKCAHGATISQLEDNEVFYLQSRGIDKASSQRLLISAFALEIINQIPVESLRDRLTQQITEKAISG